MATRPMSEGQIRRHFAAVSELLARQAAEGRAPWMRSFDGTEIALPIGLATGEPVRRSGCVWLAAVAAQQGWHDPRWCTWETARRRGGHVRRGEKATPVALPPPGPAGPRTARSYMVFNAEQCRGLEEWAPDASALHFGLQYDRAESVLRHSGAEMAESPDAGARYDLHSDRIELPPERAFGHPEAYLRTALHELGHWSGHPQRLGRESLRRGDREGRGSDAWSREELRAEIASMMVGDRLGLGHDPERHAAYADAWARILRQDPAEIAAACFEAQQICDAALQLERGRQPAWPGRREEGSDSPSRECEQERSR